ncbi:MAG: YitT family protein [Massiliimalia sp.]|jgi:uncharacterized membrane-anchored protein YitT (DUF2179 family)
MKIQKEKMKTLTLDLIYDIVGSIIFAVGIHCFVEPAQIAPGGMSGIALMINYALPFLPVGILTFVLNIPLLILSYKYLGKRLTIKTIKTLIISTVILDFVIAPLVPQYLGDRLLGSVFGGIFMGIGLALIFLRGSTTAGTDILSYLLQLKFPAMPIGRALLVIDCIILGVSAAVFGGLEAVLFGVISLYCCTKIIDTIIYGIEKGSQIVVISLKNEEISQRIQQDLDRGVTLLSGKGGYSRQNLDVLICVVKKHEYSEIKNIVHEIDPDAFVFVTETDEIMGEGFKPIKEKK